MSQLTRKNLMVKNLKRHRKLVEREQGKVEAQKYPWSLHTNLVQRFIDIYSHAELGNTDIDLYITALKHPCYVS